MQKICINSCYGGFSLSREGVLLGRKLSKNPKWGGATIIGDVYEDSKTPVNYDYGYLDIERDDKILVSVVEKLGEKANGGHAELKIVEIPDKIKWEIKEYDGFEHVAEKHRTWG